MSAKLLKVIGLVCLSIFLIIPIQSEEREEISQVEVINFPLDEEGNLLINVKAEEIFSKAVIVNEDLELLKGIWVTSNHIEAEGYNYVSYHIQNLSKYPEILDQVKIQFRNYSDEDFTIVRREGDNIANQFSSLSIPATLLVKISGRQSRLKVYASDEQTGGHIKITAYLSK